MDSQNLDAATDQDSSEPALTAHHQGATGDVGVTASQLVASPSSSSPGAHWTSGPHLDSHSRNDLRQASVALDTAYERITSLRNSINDMLNRIPSEVAGTGTSTSSTDTSSTQPRPSLSHDASIRPPHSALVLSSEQVVEELNMRAARLRSLVSPSARQRLEEFESNSRHNARRESTWDRYPQSDRPRLSRSDLHSAPPRSRTPPMPDLVLPRAAQRRELQSANRDESTTMIGRRVAARVNASDSHSNLSSRLSLSQIEQRLQAQTAQIARELENMTDRLTAQRSRRVELASSSVHGDNAATAAHDSRTFGPPQAGLATASGDLRLVPNPPTGGRPLRSARDVTLVDNTRIVLPQPISRTSSDGTPIDEFSAPSRRSLSAAFREHIATYRDHVQVGDVSQDTPRHLASTPEVRGTMVNLLARDRDDQFLSTRQAEFTLPGVDTSRREDASVRSNPASPAGQGRRRRGWSKLFLRIPGRFISDARYSATQC